MYSPPIAHTFISDWSSLATAIVLFLRSNTGFALIGGILALAWSQDIGGSNLAVFLCVPLFCLVLWAFVNHEERSRPGRMDLHPRRGGNRGSF